MSQRFIRLILISYAQNLVLAGLMGIPTGILGIPTGILGIPKKNIPVRVNRIFEIARPDPAGNGCKFHSLFTESSAID
jgi:hypothetical protein